MYTQKEIERYTKLLRQAGVPDEAVGSMLDFVYTIASVAVDIVTNKEYEKE